MSELRRRRMDMGLSIKALALASGISQEQIRNIETGRTRNPRAGTLGDLAEVLDVKPSEIDPVLTTSQEQAA